MNVLRETESTPTAWPEVTGLSNAAAALDAAPIWQRIESHIAYRWVNRQIVWVVSGIEDCEFAPPKGPLTSVTTTECWTGQSWDIIPMTTGPLDGLIIPHDGTYRITARIGTGDIPADIAQAFRRLADYLSQVPLVKAPGGSEYSVTFDTGEFGDTPHVYIAEGVKDRAKIAAISGKRDPRYLARALILSGAADLLRPYRRYS